MPQDSLRSMVYRPFVTCNDPKGVIDCKTTRKSNTSQEMEPKIETQRRRRISSEFPSNKAEITDQFHHKSSSQLLKVSKGAHQLNQMTDSWSKGPRSDLKSKDIAKDLLKGALDLQESLIILGKLQEASKYMVHLQKKEKSQFADQGYPMESQEPRVSDYRCYGNGADEIKRVIRDSIERQNLKRNTKIGEKAYLFGRNLDSASDIPSTSCSSQSSTVHDSVASSTSSASPQKICKGTNLIAKLMGLEEIPLDPLITTTPHRNFPGGKISNQGGKISNQPRPFFDIDRPNTNKTQFVMKKVDQERMSLREILDNMQYKGLPESNSFDFYSKQREIDNTPPPIVLIKPLNAQHTEKYALNMKKMLGKLKTKEHSQKTTSFLRKVEAEENQLTRISRAKGSHKEVRKSEEDITSAKQKASHKLKTSGPVSSKPHIREANDKKALNLQKATASNIKPLPKKSVEPKIISIRPRDQAKETLTKPRKPAPESNVKKNDSSMRTVPKLAEKPLFNHHIDRKKYQKKKEKDIKEPTIAKSHTGISGDKEDDKRTDLAHKSTSRVINTHTTLEDHLPLEEERDDSKLHIADTIEFCDESPSSSSDVSPVNPTHETDTKTAKEVCNHMCHKETTDRKNIKTVSDVKALLLSSLSFLSQAEDLFHLSMNMNDISNLQESCGYNAEIPCMRLSLDCAVELIERRSIQSLELVHPLLLARMGKPRMWISLDNLVQEVCDGIETLESYRKIAGENLPLDGLDAMLERDMGCKGMINGIWDFGWRSGYSMDEAERVVIDIERLIIRELIENVFT